MTSEPLPSSPSAPPRERWAGTVMIILSTICYAASHVTIRFLTNQDVANDWILFFKEFTGLLVLLPWVFLRYFQGRYRLVSKRLILMVAIAAVFCELIGARLHVLGFSVIGLVITVPLVQSATLLGSALLGRIFLGDPVSRQRKIAMAVLIFAIILLTLGKEIGVKTDNVGWMIQVACGVIVAGMAYAVYLTMLRHVLRKYLPDDADLWMSFQFTQWAGYDYPPHPKKDSSRHYSPFPVTLLMSIVYVVGVSVFGTCLFLESGRSGFTAVPPDAWTVVPISGLCNVVGFYFQVHGLRMTTTVQASLIAVSQILILALVGLLFFDETVNAWIVSGLVLTLCGVVISARPEKG